MDVVTDDPLIESILPAWRERIGVDYDGYRGHIYRMFNFCLMLRDCDADERSKLATAACFHDIGLWSAHTVDYIAPSVDELRKYLVETGREGWADELSLVVEMHHKLRPFRDDRYPLVEVFRRGDLVDFSLGVFKCGLPRASVKAVQRAIPDAGFHAFLLRGARDWFLKHPLKPPPFLRW